MKIGQRIKTQRKRAGLSQKELAKRIRIFPGPLSNIETGKHTPSIPVLMKICQILEITPNDILLDKAANTQHIKTAAAHHIKAQTDKLAKALTKTISNNQPPSIPT